MQKLYFASKYIRVQFTTKMTPFFITLSIHTLCMRFFSCQGVASFFPPLESGVDLGLALANTVWQRWWHAVSEPGDSRGLICSCLLSLIHFNLENKTRIIAGRWETIWSFMLSIKAQPTPAILSQPASQAELTSKPQQDQLGTNSLS